MVARVAQQRSKVVFPPRSAQRRIRVQLVIDKDVSASHNAKGHRQGSNRQRSRLVTARPTWPQASAHVDQPITSSVKNSTQISRKKRQCAISYAVTNVLMRRFKQRQFGVHVLGKEISTVHALAASPARQ